MWVVGGLRGEGGGELERMKNEEKPKGEIGVGGY